MARVILIWLATIAQALSGPNDPAAPTPGELVELDRINLEQNLRWMLARERNSHSKPQPKATTAVFGDSGVWHLGVRSIVEALERENVACEVLDRSRLTKKSLARFRVLILPGGWAPHQWSALGRDGLDAIEEFVRSGGKCLGICAGAYLLSKTVRYDGKEYPYPLGLFPGTAEGPVPNLAPFPKPGSVRLTLTDLGKKRGLSLLDSRACYYSGGPCFLAANPVDILARYPNGTPALITQSHGKGQIILIGVHLERPDPKLGNESAPPPHDSGKLLLLLIEGK